MNIVINGRTFESSHALVYGDYVGAGSVGVANVRWLEENRQTLTLHYRADPQYSVDTAMEEHCITAEDIESAGAIILRGDPGYHAGFILTGVPEGASEEDEILAEDGRDVLDAIENYCALDDGVLYEIEEEWKKAALAEIWKYDAPRLLGRIDEEAGRFVDHMTEGDFGIMWHEAVELPDLVEWIYEENQAYPAGFDNKAVPALLEWIRGRFAELEQQAGTLGWAIIPESPDDLATTEWGYASPGGTPNEWFAHRWQALEAAVTDTSFRDVQMRLI